MRFCENGPDIPLSLLEKHRQGKVIFLCGAGISREAGLPDFKELTEKIIETLGAIKAKKSLAAKESFDQVFKILGLEFSPEDINEQLCNNLEVKPGIFSKNHQTILDLSRDINGVARVVTTNLDRFFEVADPDIQYSVAPAVPDLTLDPHLEGVIYLHGRLREPGEQSKGQYVISSTEFGRAYLSQGWATRFVKSLRERYTLVLVGYSADDPPVRYLLDGLHSDENRKLEHSIYAFTDRSQDLSIARWEQLSVTPILYTPVNPKTHSGLWDSLCEWAKACRDPRGWKKGLMELAAKSPSSLTAHQRQMVYHFAMTAEGAKSFAESNPPPPAAWLCVFDPLLRSGSPYFLQDDVFQKLRLDNEQAPTDVRLWSPNPLTWQADNQNSVNQPIKALVDLSRWIAKVAAQPAAIYWAAGSMSIHSRILSLIEDSLLEKTDDFPAPAREFWRLFLESAQIYSEKTDAHEKVIRLVKADGWTGLTFRYLQRSLQPHLHFSRRHYDLRILNVTNINEIRLTEFISIEAHLMTHFYHPETINALKICNNMKNIFEIIENLIRLEYLNSNSYGFIPVRTEDFEHNFIRQCFSQFFSSNPEDATKKLQAWIDDPSPALKYWLSVILNDCSTPIPAADIAKCLEHLLDISHQQPLLYPKIRQIFSIHGSSLSPEQKEAIERKLVAANNTNAEQNAVDQNNHLTPWMQSNISSFLCKEHENKPLTLDEAIKFINDPNKLLGEKAENFNILIKKDPENILSFLNEAANKGIYNIDVWKLFIKSVSDNKYNSAEFQNKIRNILQKFPDNVIRGVGESIIIWINHTFDVITKEKTKESLLFLNRVLICNKSTSARTPSTFNNYGDLPAKGITISIIKHIQDKKDASTRDEILACLSSLFNLSGNDGDSAVYTAARHIGYLETYCPSWVHKELLPRFQYKHPQSAAAWNGFSCEEKNIFIDHQDETLLRNTYLKHSTERMIMSYLKEFILNNDVEIYSSYYQPYERHIECRINNFVSYLQRGAPHTLEPRLRDFLLAIGNNGRILFLEHCLKLQDTPTVWESFIEPLLRTVWPRHLECKTEEISKRLIQIAIKSGENFPDAVQTIKRFLSSFHSCWDTVSSLTRTYSKSEDDSKIPAKRYPEEVLSILGIIIHRDQTQDKGCIRSALKTIAEANPDLQNTKEWQKLDKLAP